MPILSVTESTDSDVLLIKYSLINEEFQNIKVYSYPITVGEGFTIVGPNNTSHSSSGTINGTFTITLSVSQFASAGLDWKGVHLFELTSSFNGVTNRSFGSILLGKAIDCCIADKMYTTVDCDCTDDKCNESLLDAQKMFLFKRSAEFVLKSLNSATEGPNSATFQSAAQDAQNKYNKAMELCASGCGCSGSKSVSSGSGSY